MNSSTEDPGARVLWCLRRRTIDVRCVLVTSTMPIEVHVLHERDLIIKERFAEAPAAIEWAGQYCHRLELQGWRHTPESCSPSSAA